MKRIAAAFLAISACAGSTPAPEAPTTATPVAAAEAAKPGDPGAEQAYKGLGEESVSAETIKQFAAPPLDPRVSSRIQSMLDIRGAGGGLLTSKGDRLVFGWTVTGTAQVWRQDGPMKFPIQLTGGEDRTSALALTHDDKWIVIQRDKGGAENPGLFLQSIEGGPLLEIQQKKGVQSFFAFLSDDGKSVYYRSNDEDPGSYTIYRYDLASKQREKVFGEPGLWFPTDVRGDQALLAKLLGNTHVEFYQLDLVSKKLTPLFGQNEDVEYEAQYGAKPGALIVRTNKLGEFHRLYEWSAKNPTLAPISPEIAHDVDGFAIDEARTRVVYTTNEDGYKRVHAFDAKSFKPVTLPRMPDADNVSGGRSSRNGRFTMFGYDSATTPPTTAVYDWQKRKLTPWRVPSTPEVDVSKFAKVSLEYYPARDGTKIPMFVRRPEKCASEVCPVVVQFHGGPEGQAMAGFSVYGQMFVDAGFVFVEPNVRGSEGYGKSWLHADNAARRLDIITDIEDVALFIRRDWAKNGKVPKVGVAGGSYGGYSTLMAMTYFAGAYDAGVSEVGIANLVTFLMNTAPYRRILRTTEYGDPEKDRDALVKLSPTSYVDRVKAPLLVIQGVNDPRVPVGEALLIHEALEKKGIASPLILFADEGHGTAKRGNKVLAIGHTIAFFEEHLR